jgi:WD40 repeat protein
MNEDVDGRDKPGHDAYKTAVRLCSTVELPMGVDRNSIPSIVERVHPVQADAPVVGIHFLKEVPVFVLGEEALLMAARDGEPRRIGVHSGAILSSAGDGVRLVTGGDDGKVVSTAADGASEVVATDAKRRWIDHVAVGPSAAIAWSAGKQAFARAGKGGEKSLDVVSTVGALAFAPKGTRLAIAHYNGATLWFPNTKADPETLEWKGSHLGVRFSPDGRFVVTSMQEAMLHGWRIDDHKDMRMSGYTTRVRSFGWTADGKWLATSGSNQIVLWPFQGKDGPMGKQPQLRAPSEHQAEVVACHPKQGVVAVGFADGLVLLVRTDDGAEILANRPGDGTITALAWSGSGKLLAFGTENGEAGILDMA